MYSIQQSQIVGKLEAEIDFLERNNQQANLKTLANGVCFGFGIETGPCVIALRAKYQYQQQTWNPAAAQQIRRSNRSAIGFATFIPESVQGLEVLR